MPDSPIAIARECEAILLASGQPEEAYRQYGLIANQAPAYVAWVRAVATKYPHMKPSDILDDLVAQTPGDEEVVCRRTGRVKLANPAA